MLSWPHPKQCPSKWTSIPIASAAAVPAAGDVLRANLAAGGIGHGRVNRAGLLVAGHRECDLVALPALAPLRRVRIVHLDDHCAVDVCAGAAEVCDVENHAPDVAARVERSV